MQHKSITELFSLHKVHQMANGCNYKICYTVTKNKTVELHINLYKVPDRKWYNITGRSWAEWALRTSRAVSMSKLEGVKHTVRAGRQKLSTWFGRSSHGQPVHLYFSGTILYFTLILNVIIYVFNPLPS